MAKYRIFCKYCKGENFIELDNTVPLRMIDCENSVQFLWEERYGISKILNSK
jgi:hypothetical protein